MATGLNQNVEILGRTFHVQTEVTAGSTPRLRTTVFVGGRIVGSRESAVADTEDEALREQVNRQHAMIVDTLHSRARELQKGRERLETDGPESPRETPRRHRLSPKSASLPQVEEGSRLALSIRVRQLIGPFGLSFEAIPPGNPAVLRACLETTTRRIDELMASAVFPDIRLDEQVRFFDLREQLAGWRGQQRDPERGHEIWKEIAVFCLHLRKISDRRELLAYDHQLLTWALARVGSQQLDAQLPEVLRNLYGRDAALDRLLDNPDEVEVEALLEILMELLDRTIPVEP